MRGEGGGGGIRVVEGGSSHPLSPSTGAVLQTWLPFFIIATIIAVAVSLSA